MNRLDGKTYIKVHSHFHISKTFIRMDILCYFMKFSGIIFVSPKPPKIYTQHLFMLTEHNSINSVYDINIMILTKGKA